MSAAAQSLAHVLLASSARVATAESCTGGWVAKCLTDLPGSSQWFECGWVTYSNAAKQGQLGVPGALIEQNGAVSQPVVMAMALGALERSGADYALAVTGIAGPGGGSAQKPVGTVWLGWAVRQGEVLTHCATMTGHREAIRRAAVLQAVMGMTKMVAGRGAC